MACGGVGVCFNPWSWSAQRDDANAASNGDLAVKACRRGMILEWLTIGNSRRAAVVVLQWLVDNDCPWESLHNIAALKVSDGLESNCEVLGARCIYDCSVFTCTAAY